MPSTIIALRWLVVPEPSTIALMLLSALMVVTSGPRPCSRMPAFDRRIVLLIAYVPGPNMIVPPVDGRAEIALRIGVMQSVTPSATAAKSSA
ncbi:PEP-CTERM sorting domain-containing protein [Krasilnikovia sp. MM14-A1259]|uniref:PEP-CTERM sorting domain-containing protein n=1 Tax=Krasilnikovia sp. MM14-A1259 TaxID=3373539 RepID=UPI00399CFC9D